ncbi:riboflavin synthase [Hoyosella rhizosphaerae]|uniref:Riboflavin synthase n=1 Tax=Hoyosella rhizosphaerae TaxID=1755582 RepID=A0A916U3A1_9ACTN|nr:riboflavin synthase [Hoyosella rhizosphaerae]MBN4926477.1 riboflavin synthase [Hoyosella rhizosphaerae]GGC59040.1 riboflavin synthase subunit alpha [Hoyosella rhizosphaerae]
MFTGIVEECGVVVAVDSVDSESGFSRLTVRGPLVTSDAKHGDSISVNGVCLTVVDTLEDGSFTADVMGETLDRTSLGNLGQGSPVNLERAMAIGTRLGGHIVQGHVDGTGAIVSRTALENWEVVRVSLPDSIERYVVEKGSITVDGVSLTVSAVGRDERGGYFEVSLIPTTLNLTILGRSPIGTVVNLEVDVIAKYVERLVSFTNEGPRAADKPNAAGNGAEEQ